MTAPLRVFVGSAARYLVEETVLVRSLLATATRDVEIAVIDGERHCVRDVTTGRASPLPDDWRGRIQGATLFSFARFAPPALCGFDGRAIYVESDMLALDDITELAEFWLGDAALAAVPHAALRSAASPFQHEGHLSSVVVFDADRCGHLDVVAVTDGIAEGRFTYQDAICLTDRFLAAMQLEVAPLPARWNDLERPLADTGIVHFTDFARRPWLHPLQPAGSLWTEAYLTCVDQGHLSTADVETARRAGSISRRVAVLPAVPAWCRRPVDTSWQRLEHGSTRLRHTARRLTGRVVRVARRSRRVLAKIVRRARGRG